MFVGDHFYGKVDHVPGMFFVKTRFLHYLWIPVVPRESWLICDDGTSARVRIPLRWKSVLLAWVRTFLVTMVSSLIISTVAFARMEPEAGKIHPGIIALVPWGIALVLAVIFVISYRFSRATPHRAIQLGELLSIPSADVERKFCWPDSTFDAPESREVITEITGGMVEASEAMVGAVGEAPGQVLYFAVLLTVTMGIACLGLVLGAGVLYGVTHIAGTSATVVYSTTLLTATAIPVLIARLCHRMLHQPVYFGESRGFWITLCCTSWVLGALLSIFTIL
ncbi:MAG: hypothetical protein KDB01_23940 [Planctomycetaceae bacterium]|nr:hypothetical protein [Planctomycetaceae bacterium]